MLKHLLSIPSLGCPSRAILMSGSPLTPAHRPDKSPAVVGMSLANRVGCGRNSSDPGRVLREMQELPAREVCRASIFLGDWDRWTPRAWVPDGGDRGFFPEGEPAEAIRAGRFNKMPLIVGGTRDEGLITKMMYNVCTSVEK